jgi:hypothetical protein
VYNQPFKYLLFLTPAGTIDSVQLTTDSRTTSAQLATPFRLGNFNWTNTVRYTDLNVSGRDSTFVQVPDTATGNPTDSLAVVRYFAGTFSSALDWDTGINLPFLLRGTWKIQPTIGVQNVTSGAFAIRNRNTGGDWVVQGKRAQFSLSMTPTFFAFFNVGFLPGLSRMRHSINPLLSWSFAPAASVPESYAAATRAPGSGARAAEPAAERALAGAEPELRGQNSAGAGGHAGRPDAKVPPAEHPDEPDSLRFPAGEPARRQRLGDRPGHELGAERPGARVHARLRVRPVAGQRGAWTRRTSHPTSRTST